jgi:WD40 repeat protein|tara:strand:+ start:58917 stop:61019 length:2103 start_codon:yes stop_codon:yes gene_type:complete
VRNPAYTYQGPPPVSLAERLDKLARDARDVSEEDSQIAEELATAVRAEAEAGVVEAARVAAMEARIDAREAQAESERAAARDAERRLESERQAASIASARSSDAESASASLSRRRLREREAAKDLPTLFHLDQLPDSIAAAVLREMGDFELAGVMCASSRFKNLALGDDALWGIVQRRQTRWPKRPEHRETWRGAFQRGTAVDTGWRRGRFNTSNHRVHSEYTQSVAISGDVFVTGSADKTLAVVGLPPRAPRPVDEEVDEECYDSDDEKQTKISKNVHRASPPNVWERLLARCVGHNEAVTCCKVLCDTSDSGETPCTAFSGDAFGEMRVWDLRNAPVEPWEMLIIDGYDDGTSVHTAPYSVPCTTTKRLTSPATGAPHAQFFDVSSKTRSGAACAACAGDTAGAGVHVYDVSRFGAATFRFELPNIAVYGVTWGSGSCDTNVVYAACDDGVVRLFDARTNALINETARTTHSVGNDTTALDSSSNTTNSIFNTAGAATGAGDTNSSHHEKLFRAPSVHRSAAAMCVAADGDLFCFGSARGTVHVRDVRKTSVPLCVSSESKRWHDDCVNTVAINTKVRRVVSGGDDGAVRWRRLPFDTCVNSGDGDADVAATVPPSISTGVGVLGVAFDHSRLVVGCMDTTVRVYDAVTGDDFVDAEALREAWREVCLRARDTGNLADRPVRSGGERSANTDWGNYRV